MRRLDMGGTKPPPKPEDRPALPIVQHGDSACLLQEKVNKHLKGMACPLHCVLLGFGGEFERTRDLCAGLNTFEGYVLVENARKWHHDTAYKGENNKLLYSVPLLSDIAWHNREMLLRNGFITEAELDRMRDKQLGL